MIEGRRVVELWSPHLAVAILSCYYRFCVVLVSVGMPQSCHMKRMGGRQCCGQHPDLLDLRGLATRVCSCYDAAREGRMESN